MKTHRNQHHCKIICIDCMYMQKKTLITRSLKQICNLMNSLQTPSRCSFGERVKVNLSGSSSKCSPRSELSDPPFDSGDPAIAGRRMNRSFFSPSSRRFHRDQEQVFVSKSLVKGIPKGFVPPTWIRWCSSSPYFGQMLLRRLEFLLVTQSMARRRFRKRSNSDSNRLLLPPLRLSYKRMFPQALKGGC